MHAFWLPPSVKDAIEAIGIPHTEVGLILRNGEVAAVPTDTVADALPPRVRARHHTFFRCQQCGRVYWRGTRYQRKSTFLARTCGK